MPLRPSNRRPGPLPGRHADPQPDPDSVDAEEHPGGYPEEPSPRPADHEEEPGEQQPGLPGEEEEEESAQRFADDGVKQDMASIAVHPSSHAGATGPAGAPPALPAGGWQELSDAEIMLRVAAGDEAGFGLLVEKYRRQMVHFMYRMVHNQAVAEELAQEVFLRVYRARTSYRAEAKFSTWLYRIATNLGVNHARDTRHERSAHAVYLDQPDPETGSTPDVADSTPNIEQELLREARLAAIRKHVMALPERQRTAVLMHKYQDLDYKQIGAVLKLSESATKSLLFRAYQTLRERLQEFV
jgi:RNA polymerase sigma-70 factor (ECF subfamily)